MRGKFLLPIGVEKTRDIDKRDQERIEDDSMIVGSLRNLRIRSISSGRKYLSSCTYVIERQESGNMSTNLDPWLPFEVLSGFSWHEEEGTLEGD